MKKQIEPDVVIVGAGPVGLWTAIQIKKHRPDLQVRVYERHETYQRSHVLRLEHASMLLYGKNTFDQDEKEFFNSVTGHGLMHAFQAAARAGAVYIRTDDLETSLKKYAQALGVDVAYEQVDDPKALMEKHPGCALFVAADGAHSRMRTALMGKDSVQDFPMQYVVEIKYQADGAACRLDFLGEHRKVNREMTHMAFEYVGRLRGNITPVTLRFFVDKETYDALPEAGFKDPLKLKDPRIPASLQKDIDAYLAARRDHAGEHYSEGSAKISKLTLSTYKAKRFAQAEGDKAWFLAGDAAMGLPYFRSLNAGMIVGSQLAFILTRKHMSPALRTKAYNALRPLDTAFEFAAANGKNMAVNAYDMFRFSKAKSRKNNPKLF